MSSAFDVIIHSLATMLSVIAVGFVIVWFIQDVTQKKHSILRNYPVIGRLRYFFELQGKYFRQYFFANDRDEMPFNRATRAWIYKNAKNKGSLVGFGSTNDLRQPGAIIFVNAAFPIQEEDQLPTPSLHIGQDYCQFPFEAKSIVNISGM
ncbi:MAG TPA: FMN-binding glutamate synthase family protein, partial [Nitrosomonas sp.]|nr:FMN-binding glutamate synthase family protein [Nitrosomonas sp.]